MDERIKTQLAGADVDVDEMLARFNHNESLAMNFLLRFPDDPCFSQLKQGLAQQDIDLAYTAAHSLKGLSGNLSMKALFRQATQVVDDLRRQDLPAAASKLGLLDAEYTRVVQALAQIQ